MKRAWQELWPLLACAVLLGGPTALVWLTANGGLR